MPITAVFSEIRLAEREEVDNSVRAPVVGKGESGDVVVLFKQLRY